MVAKLLTWWRRWRCWCQTAPFLWLGITVLGLSLALSWPYWQRGFPYTHDGENHLARFMNYTAALREGQWPPRFAPYLNSQFGFPVFEYNYPLANILAVPGVVLGLHPARIFAWQVFFAVGIGLFAGYFLARKWFSPAASRFATALLGVNSSWWNAILFRGNIGELWATSLALTFLALVEWQPRRNRRWWQLGMIFVSALLLLSHNVLALLFGCVIAVWVFVRYPRQWRQWLSVGALAVAATLWFWLPAIAELSLVVLQGDSLAHQAQEHLLSWNQLLFSPLQFGFSFAGELDTLGFGQGIAWLAVLFISFGWCLKTIMQKRITRSVVFFISAGVILFLTSFWSAPIWGTFPWLGIVQFPWRLLALLLIFVPLLGARVLVSLPRLWRWALWLLVLFQLIGLMALRPVDRRSIDATYYLLFPHTTTTRNENRPKTFTATALPSWEPRPTLATGSATFVINSWRGSSHMYEAAVAQDAVIVEPTVYFPGWETKIDGKKVEAIFTSDTQGFVAYALPAREAPYKVVTAFRGRTPIRIIGEAVSLLTCIGLALVIGKELYALWSHRHHPHA